MSSSSLSRRSFLGMTGSLVAGGAVSLGNEKARAALLETGALQGPTHVSSPDVPLIDAAFLHGYVHNIVEESVPGGILQCLTVGDTDRGVHIGGGRKQFSVWTRDLYWGFLGWAQAGDDSVLLLMRSSLQLLLMAKAKNQARGQNPSWPLNDKRFYIPQAFTTGLVIAVHFFQFCSESQADFLLLAYNYWRLSGDLAYIESIWPEIAYITQSIQLMDTNGNSLPDALWGTYDYQAIRRDTEEPLMSAKTGLAYRCVSAMAQALGKQDHAAQLADLSDKVKQTMNRPVKDGGLWKEDSRSGYYAIRKQGAIDPVFVPYENLVPMWCGMTSPAQEEAIFNKLDAHFSEIYDLPYGPMYCAPLGEQQQCQMQCSSVPWLAFLDVYLRGKKGHTRNRSRIYDLLMKHALDAGGIPFSEGVGISGCLTGGAGRAWDNGNFFHMLVSGIYGIEKSNEGIQITAPAPIEGTPFTELRNMRWGNATCNFRWRGVGTRIESVRLNGKHVYPQGEKWVLRELSGDCAVDVVLRQG